MKKILSLIILTFIVAFAFAQNSSLTDMQYFTKYIEELDKTQKLLTYMNKKSSLAKMGTETINGSISGTLFYTVKLKGTNAEVVLRYTNFSCEKGWTFDGEIIVTSSMAQNGTYEGSITVTGDYPVQIFYDDLIMKKGKLDDGNFYLQRPNCEKVAIPFSAYNDIQEAKKK